MVILYCRTGRRMMMKIRLDEVYIHGFVVLAGLSKASTFTFYCQLFKIRYHIMCSVEINAVRSKNGWSLIFFSGNALVGKEIPCFNNTYHLRSMEIVYCLKDIISRYNEIRKNTF